MSSFCRKKGVEKEFIKKVGKKVSETTVFNTFLSNSTQFNNGNGTYGDISIFYNIISYINNY